MQANTDLPRAVLNASVITKADLHEVSLTNALANRVNLTGG